MSSFEACSKSKEPRTSFFFKLHIKERHKFLSIQRCSQLSRKEENLQLFSKVYSMIDKTVWKIPKRHVLPQARAILKTKMTETSLSWNIPDLIIDACKGSFGTDGFLPSGTIWRKLFLAQVLVLRVSLEHRLRSKILRKFCLFQSQPPFPIRKMGITLLSEDSRKNQTKACL